ncbi:organic solvent resistance ABC transporter substrate-binding protein [Cyanobium sp. Copco_Reservoir_LC18]|uniref:MlaD family protein n=1 Tax=Cyanobium sp. Copco_Reservoir_LC18 TaxID=1328305 RepID=UPI00135CC593|nr:MlaD family protein [Cyanobium sp. Copco_Reservoir_LC18]KAF0654847.1 organic solvent resistance ABC transporter substrate-binding protein [Cyanobium sp. Copco_Reservoir_LC18]
MTTAAPAPAPPRRPGPQSLVFLAGAVALLGVFVFGIARSGNWLAPSVRLQFRTLDAAGLQTGMAVRISGFAVGQVRRIVLQPDAQVLVELELRDPYRSMVGRRSRAELAQLGLLGDSYIAITPDPAAIGQPPIGDGETLVFTSRPDIDDLIAEVASSRIPLQRAVSSGLTLAETRLPRSLDELDRTLVASRRLATRLEADTRRSSSELNRTLGATRQLAERLEGRADGTAADLSALIKRLESTESQTRPLLLQTLRELSTMAAATNRLVKTLNESWVIELIERTGEPRTEPGR